MLLLVQAFCATKMAWAAVSDNRGTVYWLISQRHPDDDQCRSKGAADLFRGVRISVTFFCTWWGSISIKVVCSNWGPSCEHVVLKTEHQTQSSNCAWLDLRACLCKTVVLSKCTAACYNLVLVVAWYCSVLERILTACGPLLVWRFSCSTRLALAELWLLNSKRVIHLELI
jgi:hypothetical protein